MLNIIIHTIIVFVMQHSKHWYIIHSKMRERVLGRCYVVGLHKIYIASGYIDFVHVSTIGQQLSAVIMHSLVEKFVCGRSTSALN